MRPATVRHPQDELERCVAAFETAWQLHGTADLASFLPDCSHALFATILAELIRIDLEFQAQQGAVPRLAQYRSYAPDLFADAHWVQELAFEEYRQRIDRGDAPCRADYARDYGVDVLAWPEVNGQSRTVQSCPAVGDVVEGFRLVRSLGQGSFGQVYLAEQLDLAGRLVAIKLTPHANAIEPDTLARLQHTHIVPIYSSHTIGNSHIIVMPYLGSTTLADVLAANQFRGEPPVSGRSLADTIADRASQTLGGQRTRPPVTTASPSIPLEQLKRQSYPDAVLWIGWKLAEALAHAHDRGILHRDIKPANVLLTDDGVPMLLDFNLAGDTNRPERQLGGTPAYMAPEQARAMRIGHGDVDGRADIYSLGRVLAELLIGRAASAHGQLPGRVANVSPSFLAILKTCLAESPADRYATAHDLANELQRQLTHQPLALTRESSYRERLRKWQRRHPVLSSSGSVAAVAGMLLLLLVGTLIARQRHVDRLIGEQAANAEHHAFVNEWPQVAERLLFLNRDPTADDAFRKLVSIDVDPPFLSRDQRQERRELLAELLVLKSHTESDTEAARAWSERAIRMWRSPASVPRAVWDDQYRYAKKLGREHDAQRYHDLAAAAPARGRDWYYSGLTAHANHDMVEARELFERATREEPTHVWSWLMLGDTWTELDRDDRAMSCFQAAIVLKPTLIGAYFNRGLCHYRRREFADAIADFRKVLELDSNHLHARRARGLAYVGAGQFAEAEREFTQAIQAGSTMTELWFLRAEARTRSGDALGAAADREQGFTRPPQDEISFVKRGLARAQGGDAAGALHDYHAALALNPRSYSALMNLATLYDQHFHRHADTLQTLDRLVTAHPSRIVPRASRAVLLARGGQREKAHRDAAICLAHQPPAEIIYQLAGVYALTSRQHPSDAERAFELLRLALRHDAGYADLATDADLNAVRERAEFNKLLEATMTLMPSKR